MSERKLDGGVSPTLLIDASIYIFQYYFALPDHWYSQKHGWPTAAVYGYTAFLIRLIQQQNPKRIAACFDESLESCFRNKIYSGYKSSRVLPDPALAFQLKACKRVTQLLGITTYASNTHEADDLIGSLYRSLCRSVKPIAILTRDKDLGQLLNRSQDFLWDYAAKSATAEEISCSQIGVRYFIDDIQEKFGVLPQQFTDYLSLVGDSIDDIPGVPGLGAKTAQQLLQYFGSVDNMFKQCDINIDAIDKLPIRGAKKLREKLEQYREQIAMAKQLATIVVTLELITGVNDIQWQEPRWPQLKRFCQKMGFPKLFQTMSQLNR